jgi:diguanylate cyclase (GGDEF)-like protein
MFRRLRRFLAVEAENPQLIKAQQAAFTRQIPLLYFMLVTNVVALSLTHVAVAPLLLTFYIPAALCFGCCVRIWGWWRSRHNTVSHDSAVRQLQGTVYVGVFLGVGFTAWSLSLFPYGNAYTQVHVAFFMAITVIGCIFCLMHLRTAALLIAGVVLIPFTLFFASTGNAVFIAIAVNMALVSAAMVYILFRHYAVFVELIESQKALVSKQTETQKLSDENRRLADTDSLTELPNRRSFRAEFVKRLARANAEQRKLAVGIIDLDGFKAVNDAFGHAAGDHLLVEAARRLRDFSEDGVFCARLSGDEFGLLIDAALDDTQLSVLTERICHSLQQPYYIKGITANVSGSCGIAKHTDGSNAVQLFERADYALYHAKQNRRGHAVVFSQDHERQIINRSRVDQELKNADLDAEFHVLFQPFVDSGTHAILGFEALARWESPSLGRVTPDVFIPAAERSEIMGTVTNILLRKALASACQWPAGTRLSFNLSARDIVSRETIDMLLRTIADSGFNASCLDLEVTETAVMTNFDLAVSNIDLLMTHGIGIALDDFGTGHSSLGYVHRLPLRKIKIDRSFIADIDTNVLSRNIIRTIVDLCRNIGCVCVIEGMETAEQVLILRTLGCGIMQGYYFGRPMPLAETMEKLAAQQQAEQDYPEKQTAVA